MPPLSAHVNENRQGLDFKDYGIHVYWIYCRYESKWNGGRGWTGSQTPLEIIHLICIALSYFCLALSLSSAWPSLTTAATSLTSSAPSIPFTVLNLRVTEIGHRLCQIEVKYEAEVSQGWVQSLQPPSQRYLWQRPVFTVRCFCRRNCYAAMFSLSHFNILGFCWKWKSQSLMNAMSSLIFMLQSHPDEA